MPHLATVYNGRAASGQQSIAVKIELRGRLGVATPTLATESSPHRAAGTEIFRWLWDPDYVMPETAQIEVAGVRYNPVAGKFQAPEIGGEVIYRACNVVRVET